MCAQQHSSLTAFVLKLESMQCESWMLLLIPIFLNCSAIEWQWTFLYAQWSEFNLMVGVDTFENTLFAVSDLYLTIKIITHWKWYQWELRTCINKCVCVCVSRRSAATLFKFWLFLTHQMAFWIASNVNDQYSTENHHFAQHSIVK